MKVQLKNDWGKLLEDEIKKDYYRDLMKFLEKEYKNQIIYPEIENIFSALDYTSYRDTKVVILGQDPYHGPNQSHGMAFSVKAGVKIPPSLRNIYKELKDDLGYEIPNHGFLRKWAEEGVLLLNTSFTVREGQANSHSNIGWEIFTDKIMEILNKKEDPIVFIFWGNNAKTKEKLITNPKHHIIKSYHPSPLSASRGFFGTKPFSRSNEFLKSVGKKPIDWKIENI